MSTSLDTSLGNARQQAWPALSFDAGRDTWATLHMWTQIVGKIRRVQMPWFNHSWHVALYLTARGMTTSPIPCGTRVFEIDFDFIDHELQVLTSDGMRRTLALRPRSVADFYQELFASLAELGLDIRIHASPNEVIDAIPFEQDLVHASYDAAHAHDLWRALLQVDRVFK